MFTKAKIFSCMSILILGLLVSAQDEPASLFVPVDTEPAIPHNEGFKYTDPGAMIYHDDVFHMLRNSFPDWPQASDADYWTSADGIEWEMASEDTVFHTEDVTYAGIAALASSLIMEDDGTWVLYFYAWNGRPGTTNAGTIGRATATNIDGPWAIEEEPILAPSNRDEWDGSQMTAPHVIRTDEGYRMYYSGTDDRGRVSIGLATSEDGIAWEKYDDPSTTEAPYAESDPILLYEEDWEGTRVHQARVLPMDEGWVMVYRAQVRNGNGDLGMAFSEDGITWEKYPDNPIFEPEVVEGGVSLWFTNVIAVEDTLYLFVEIAPDRSVTETNIYVATIDWETIHNSR